MVSLMVVALTNKVSLNNSELKALKIYMRIVSKEDYEMVASKIICCLMRYHIYLKSGSRFNNPQKARRALKKLIYWTKKFRYARRKVM